MWMRTRISHEKADAKLIGGIDQMRTRLLPKFINGGLLLLSVLLSLITAECIVRFFDIGPRPLAPLAIPTYRLSADPILGYEYRPGYRPTDNPFDSLHQGYAINSDGFRDHDYSESKSIGTYRIVVLGDSTTAGNGVANLDDTYPKRLEKYLNTEPQFRFEVLNMGVGGYHTMQEVETLRVKGLKYKPDMVIVTFCINDFDLHADGGVYGWLVQINKGRFSDYRESELKKLLLKSRLAFMTFSLLPSWNGEKGENPVRAGLLLLSELQQKVGFKALVFILPAFSEPFDQYKYKEIHDRVFRSAKDLPEITVIDLLPFFSTVNKRATVFSYDGMHMNEYGHEEMAKMLLTIVKGSAAEQPSPVLRYGPLSR